MATNIPIAKLKSDDYMRAIRKLNSSIAILENWINNN